MAFPTILTQGLCMALLVLTLRASSFASASRELGEMSMIERHERWMAQHGKAYEDAAEKERRFEIFKSNFKLIQTFNKGNHKFRLGLNRFADLTNDEFRAHTTASGRSRARRRARRSGSGTKMLLQCPRAWTGGLKARLPL
uniref:Cathepsin propeptide inhibitor domain-containing protein n=1 Tax=Ananas comosus var. bracteatus TaxID=296719 RepID=A0A6V7QD52_ANACO|nr:unnamed protein product [Ananas comosus var. bracteatus]